MNFVPRCLNTLWMWNCRREWRAFQRALCAPAETQTDVLLKNLRRNADSEFGRRYQFASIKSPAEYQRRVPIGDYETFVDDVDRIARGDANVLTCEPVRLLEPTSGSTAGRKLIPYTDSLRREFQRMVAAWIYDMFRRRPAVRRGRAYWSISPALETPEQTTGGIPIGFDDDTAYLGGLERLLMHRLLATPPDVAQISDIDTFRHTTLFWLLNTGDLSLISVWSPTFLTALLQPLEESTDRLCADFAHSRDTPGVRPARAKRVRRILQSSASLPEKLQQLWPDLAVISCWTDATAANYLPELQRMFPRVEIQPKGLLATEGCVSFPLVDRTGAAPALRSHFLEFAERGAASNGRTPPTRLVHELEPGGEYEVVLTTGGGLYRYRLGDIVKVTGLEERCPLLTFLGRAGCASDLVGEKLSESFVRAALDATFAELGVAPRFALVVPLVSTGSHYRLYLQLEPHDSLPTPPADLAARIQKQLEDNPHYEYAVRLKQLAPLDVRLLNPYGEPGWNLFERRGLSEGRRAGDIKPASLDARSDWEQWFAPAVQPRATDSPSKSPTRCAGGAPPNGT